MTGARAKELAGKFRGCFLQETGQDLMKDAAGSPAEPWGGKG